MNRIGIVCKSYLFNKLYIHIYICIYEAFYYNIIFVGAGNSKNSETQSVTTQL